MTTTPSKYYQVSEFTPPDELISIIVHQRTTSIPYYRWCQREIERWKATNDRECWCEENSEGLIALFSHAEYQRPISEES